MAQNYSKTCGLIIGGCHVIGNQEVELTHYGSLYNYFFSEKISMEYCSVKTEYELSNYLRGYSFEEFKIIYLIYVGHGEGQDDTEYPYISPFETINLMNVKMKNKNEEPIRFRILFNCCNINSVELNDKALEDIFNDNVKSNIEKFLCIDFDYVCLRKGLADSAFSNRTIFNESLFNTLVNYRFNKSEDFLGIFNYNLGYSYKKNKNIKNRNIKKYISSSTKFNSNKSETDIEIAKVSDLSLPSNYMINEDNCSRRTYIDYHAKYNDDANVFGTPLNVISI